FLEMPGHGLVDALRLDEFDESELHCFVTVFFLGAPLHDDTRARLQHGATHQGAVVLEDLRHAQLDSDNSVDRHRVFSFFRSLSLMRILAACCPWFFVLLDSTRGRTKSRPY